MGKRPYHPDFRREAVRQVMELGRSQREVATALGVSNATISGWVHEAETEARVRAAPLAADERAELVELRRRVKVLETEREILKKAAAFFASETERTR
jgi:transposase